MEIRDEDYINTIDFAYIKNIVEKNQAKKIFCFGGGTAAEILMEKMDGEIQIEKFLDNNKLLYGKKINGIEIAAPESILKEENGSYIVLVLSRHIHEISLQLDGYGLNAGKDYFDIYSQFTPYFLTKKHLSLMDEFQKFVERIPDNELGNRPILHKNKVGVVYASAMYRNYTSYCLAEVLLLRYYGYPVSLIIDTLPTFESYSLFEGFEKIVGKKVEQIVAIIKAKCNDIEILHIEQEGKQELTADDKYAVMKNKLYTLMVYDAYPSGSVSSFLSGEQKREEIAESILTNTLMYIKAFFNKHSFDSIDVPGGKGSHRGNYLYYGKKLGIRVSTYDTTFAGKMLYSTDGITAHLDDITKLVQNSYFNYEENKRLVELAKDSFSKRKSSTVGNGNDCQLTGYQENIHPYDVIIPLNIFWDAAAVQVDKVFYDYMDWLEQTLEFLMENTNASVMLREHPAQELFPAYVYTDFKENLPIITKYKERIFFAAASEKVNTYQYLEQCKLVLPYTSTVGIESVLLGKNVITHTDVYYNNINVVFEAENKEQYFDAIKNFLQHTELAGEVNVDNAYLAYFFHANAFLECEYCINNTSWMKMTLKELSELTEVSWVVLSIGSGVPTIYSKISNTFLKNK